MELELEGIIKKIRETFGIVTDEITNNDYLFYTSSSKSGDENSFKTGDLVTFKLKENNRGDFDATKVVLKKRAKKTTKQKKIKYFFEDKNDAAIGLNFIKEKLNKDIYIEGILLTMYDKRNRISLEVKEEVKKESLDADLEDFFQIEVVDGETLYVCNICNDGVDNENMIKRHMHENHEEF